MAEDDVWVDKIEAYVDGTLIATQSWAATSCSLVFSWSARLLADGAHEISALAYDASGNVGLAPPITVTVTKKKNGRY